MSGIISLFIRRINRDNHPQAWGASEPACPPIWWVSARGSPEKKSAATGTAARRAGGAAGVGEGSHDNLTELYLTPGAALCQGVSRGPGCSLALPLTPQGTVLSRRAPDKNPLAPRALALRFLLTWSQPG